MGVRDMKKILATAAMALAFGIASLAAAGAEPVKVGFSPEAYPPFYSADASGNWTGWEVEIAHAICAEAKFECELTPIPWDGLIPALTTKKIDAIMNSMSITEERKKTIDFTNMYYNTPTVIIGPKNGDKDISPEHLKGKTLGAQVSTIHERYLRKYYPESEIKTYQTQDEANNDLAAGRLDYVQADGSALSAFLKTEQGQACCELKDEVPDDPAILGEGVGGGVRKEDTALKEKLNAAIAELVKNGEIQKITEKYPDLKAEIVLPTT
jgi:polar amino acid transport system substrate-binding protein